MLTVIDKLEQIKLNKQQEEELEPADSTDMYEDDYDEDDAELSDLEAYLQQEDYE